MNTTDNPEQHDDERSPAVVRAEAGARAWRAAVRHQRSAVPDHADFYALAADVCETLRALEDLAHVLAAQVHTYDQGRRLYDDSRQVDPRERLASASLSLVAVADMLIDAQVHANAFFSAIGHVGVEVTP